MALLAAASVFVTVLFFALSFSGGHASDPVRVRVAGLSTARAYASGQPIPTFSERILGPLLEGVVEKILAILPLGMLNKLKIRLVRAGDPLTPEGFIMICLAGGGVLGGLAFLLNITAKGTLDVKSLGMIVLMTGAGIFLPFMWLSNRVRQRQTAIMKSLPDSFDMITTCVEAGLGLDAALTRVAEKVKGPFSDDLSVTLREVGMGRNRSEALRDLADNTGVADLSMFVNAIIQAEQMGTSIGQVLRVQSDQMRTRRRQRAEELANQAPVKMVFPLVMCILPALFVVIMGPAGIALYQTFTQKG